jgi:hypothetical protein
MSWFGRVSPGVPAAVFTACMGWVMPASAGDWTATMHIGETVEANDNPQLLPKSPGGTVGSITNLSVQAVDTTPTLHWEIGTDLGFSQFWGPGATSSLDGVKGGVVHTALEKSTPLTDYTASFSTNVLPASTSEILDSGITNANTTTISYSGAGGLKHQLNGLNALGLSVSGSSEFFTNNNGSPSAASGSKSGLTPNTYLTTGQSWIHTVTPLTDFAVAASTAWYSASGVTGTDSVSESVTGQVHTQLSERLSLTAGGGGDVIRTTRNADSISTGGSADSTSTGFIANAQLAYALTNNTSVSAFASHNLAPSSLGSVQELTQVGLTVGHRLDEASSVGFSGIFVYQVPVTSIQANTTQLQRQALVLSVGYQRILSRYWDLHLSYNFTQQDNGDTGFLQPFNDKGSSTSNAVFLTLTRSFNLLGPSADNVPAAVRGGYADLVGPPALPIRVPDNPGILNMTQGP